jgi:acetyl-CoA acetyltransferase
VGETDYHLDYQASRKKPPGYEAPSPEGLALTAFERALADSGLRRDEIDGLSVSFIYGGPAPADMAELLGVKPRHLIDNGGIMAGPLPVVCADIATGKCDTVAMVYAAASRAIGRQYGGRTYQGMGGAPASYYYHQPWGWTSQAAHWAFVWSRYQAVFGAREEDLGAVAMQLRRNAMANPNAVMQTPISAEDYLQSRYIVRPLHLLDMCLVNDGAVCLIIRRADRTRGLPHAPVLVAGWGEAEVKTDKLDCLVRERLRPPMEAASRQMFEMAGAARSDVQHFEAYDASSIHLVSQLEGFGFVPPGEGLEFCKAGGMAVDGDLPMNTSGGMLSEAYMHGWNHVAEITRQLRHEAGPRQIPGVETSLFSLAQTDAVHPLLFQRGA